MGTRAVVVGTDGTASSKAAVRWAAVEAQRRNLPLRIVHAFDWEWREGRYDGTGVYLDLAQRVADAIAANAFDQAHDAAAAVSIETTTMLGRAAPRLLAAAKGAELLVVGSRGRGGFAGLLLGSVSRRVAAHAACPVVVVRGRDDATSGPVVAGVDESPAAEGVLETAFEAASLRGAPLAVVHAYLPEIPLWLRSSVPPSEVATPEQDTDERALVDQLVAPWRTKYPDVPVETILSHDSAAAVLAGVSHGAQLIVVGSHGRGPVAEAMLGSTGAQLLRHADCPVYLTRPPA